MVEQSTLGFAVPLLVLVVCWLCLLFFSFALFAPRNATVITALFVCALAAAGTIYMMLELNPGAHPHLQQADERGTGRNQPQIKFAQFGQELSQWGLRTEFEYE